MKNKEQMPKTKQQIGADITRDIFNSSGFMDRLDKEMEEEDKKLEMERLEFIKKIVEENNFD